MKINCRCSSTCAAGSEGDGTVKEDGIMDAVLEELLK